MGLTTAAPTQTQSPNTGRTQETPLETIKNRIQNLADNYEQIQQQAEQFRNHRMQISEKASLIHVATQHHGIPHKEIYPEHAGPPELDIENIQVQMFQVRIEAQITEIQSTNQFSGGQVRSIIIKDGTGKTQVTAWDDDTVVWDQFEEGDRIMVEDAYTNQEISDYQRDRFGVPAIQLKEGSVVARDTGEGWDEYEL